MDTGDRVTSETVIEKSCNTEFENMFTVEVFSAQTDADFFL